jgi:hypothetical protein
MVVARAGNRSNHADALREALSVAQQGLDLLSIEGRADLSTHEVDDWHITWWEELSGVVLRVTELVTFGARIDVAVTKRDSQGNVVLDPPPPPTPWDESYRYFRLAQVTDDLFDAYRNLYLALESLLHSIEPVRQDPNTGRFESEKKWFKRAIGMTNVANLADFAPPGAKNPPHDIYVDLYQDTRTSLFHAKGNRPHLRPHEAEERGRVEESLKRLTRLYLAIVEAQHGVRRRSGGVTEDGFQLMTSLLDSGAQTFASDEALPETDIPSGLTSGAYHALPTRRAPEMDRPFFKSILGSATFASLPLLSVSQLVLVTNSGIPMATADLDGSLTLDHVHRFEAHLPLRMRHPQLPREFYST